MDTALSDTANVKCVSYVYYQQHEVQMNFSSVHCIDAVWHEQQDPSLHISVTTKEHQLPLIHGNKTFMKILLLSLETE